jgi:hypothetical protein
MYVCAYVHISSGQYKTNFSERNVLEVNIPLHSHEINPRPPPPMPTPAMIDHVHNGPNQAPVLSHTNPVHCDLLEKKKRLLTYNVPAGVIFWRTLALGCGFLSGAFLRILLINKLHRQLLRSSPEVRLSKDRLLLLLLMDAVCKLREDLPVYTLLYVIMKEEEQTTVCFVCLVFPYIRLRNRASR